MQGHEVNEQNWKLFRKRLPEWQERCTEKLIHSYLEVLTSDTPPTDRFWMLEKRIRQDQLRFITEGSVNNMYMDTGFHELCR